MSFPNPETLNQPSLTARLKAHKTLLLAVLVVTFCAGAVRLFTFTRYYPVDDYPDEPNYIALASDVRGTSDQTALKKYYGTLAPLYVELSALVQDIYSRIVNHPWEIPGEYLYVMRAVSAVSGVLTALVILWLGWQIAGVGAGVVAGVIWGVSPSIIRFNSLAIPDPLVYLVSALGVAAGLYAWKRQSFFMLVVSFLCGIAAIYIKLWIVTALLPFVLAGFLLLKADRRWLKRLMALYFMGILFALHFLFVIRPFSDTNKIQMNLDNGDFLSNLFSLPRLANNFYAMIYPTDSGTGATYIVLGLGIAAYIYSRRRKAPVVSGSSLLFISLCLLANWWLSAGISRVNVEEAGKIRHILPASVSFIALWAVLLVQIGWTARNWLADRNYQARWLSNGVAAVALLLVFPGFIISDAQQIANFNKEHVITQTLAWFDNSPPHDGTVLSPGGSIVDVLWNRFWGFYTGSKPYNQWFEPMSTIIDTPPAAYLARDITWLVLDARDIERAKKSADALRSYLDKLLLVKTTPGNSDKVTGYTTYVYRLALPDYAADYSFGGAVKLVGYDLSSVNMQAGTSITFRPYWKLAQPISRNLSMFFHLYSAASVAAGKPELLAQVDTTPMHNTNFPTSLWRDTDEIYFGDQFIFTIPADLPPGDYVLALGLYDYLSGERLTGQDNNTYYRINIKVS